MIAELRTLFLAVVPGKDSRIWPATRQEAWQSVEVSQGAAGAGHKDAGKVTGFAPDLHVAPGEESTKGWTAAKDGWRKSQCPGWCCPSWRNLGTGGCMIYQMQPCSPRRWKVLSSNPVLGWQKSQGQELDRSAGTQSCPFMPAGIGLMAVPRVVRPPCALLLCGHEP